MAAAVAAQAPGLVVRARAGGEVKGVGRVATFWVGGGGDSDEDDQDSGGDSDLRPGELALETVGSGPSVAGRLSESCLSE